MSRRDTGGHGSAAAEVSNIKKARNIPSQSDNLDVDAPTPPPRFHFFPVIEKLGKKESPFKYRYVTGSTMPALTAGSGPLLAK